MTERPNLPLVMCRATPYRTSSYHTSPYRTSPYHASPYHTLPYHTIPYLAVPYHTIPYYTVSAVPYLTVPYLTGPHLTSPDLSTRTRLAHRMVIMMCDRTRRKASTTPWTTCRTPSTAPRSSTSESRTLIRSWRIPPWLPSTRPSCGTTSSYR